MERIMTNEHPVLATPISELALSDEFMEMACVNHFSTLGEIVKVPVYKLVGLPQFGYRMLNELFVLLKEYKLDSVLIED